MERASQNLLAQIGVRLQVALLAEHDEHGFGRIPECAARHELENPFRESGRQEDVEPEPSLAGLIAQRIRLSDIALRILPIGFHFVVAHAALAKRSPMFSLSKTSAGRATGE